MTLPHFRGHDELRATLIRALGRDALPATLLIHGEPGSGKQSLALWLARARLCTGEDPPCGACKSCRMAMALQHPDVHWFFPLERPKGSHSKEKLAEALEAARHAKLGELRSQPLQAKTDTDVKGIYLATILSIRRAAHRRPVIGDEQIFVIGDAEYLVPQEASPEAANALLKLLEEPPGSSRFILTSSMPEGLLETIRSRALPIHLPPLSDAEVKAFLVEECGASDQEAGHAAALAQGSIGMAMGHLDADGAEADQRGLALELLKAAAGGRRAAAYAHVLAKYGPSGARGLMGRLAALQDLIRDLGAAALERPEHVVNQDHLSYLTETARGLSLTPERAAQAVDRVEEARMLALGNVNPQLLVSTLLLDLETTLAGESEA